MLHDRYALALRAQLRRAQAVMNLRLAVALVAATAFATTVAVVPEPSLAYEGSFCNRELGPSGYCASSTVVNIRRAIAKAPGGWTEVEIETYEPEQYAFNKCTSNGCTANTGYLSKDGRGYGGLSNPGSGTHAYSGYLYP